MPSVSFVRTLCSAVVALAVMAVAGCSQLKPDPVAEEQAQLAYTHLVNGEDDALDAMFIPAARNPHDKEIFAQMRTLIPKSALQSTEQVNWQSYMGTGGRRMTFQHLYHYGDRQVMATTVLVEGQAAGGWGVQSFNVEAGLAPPAAPSPAPEKGTKL